jgi:hypothetical protein
VLIRGIKVPAHEVQQQLWEWPGSQVVPDTEISTILNLDKCYFGHMQRHGVEPIRINYHLDPLNHYIVMPLRVKEPITGRWVRSPKPGYLRYPKRFFLGGKNE